MKVFPEGKTMGLRTLRVSYTPGMCGILLHVFLAEVPLLPANPQLLPANPRYLPLKRLKFF